ncbi:MAG: nucleotide exchange factor GrpE [Dehalococcoidia bacterium]|nr:nucleotide exchange factor GrpE [Dehalococcoidia bacterium]
MAKEERENQFAEVPSEANQPVDELMDMGSLQKALTGEREKSEKYLASWQRSQADFINFKKRNEQEKAETVKFANSALMSGLLPVLDDFERALENVTPKAAGTKWVEGIELIYRKFLAVLESQGLSKVETDGADFDPRFHEAVIHDEGEEGKITQELQKGYMLYDRLLRPSMVKVGKGKESESG